VIKKFKKGVIMTQKTKIVATVGPASRSFDGLLELLQAGVDVFRLNFSHGTHDDHREVIEMITRINNEFDTPVGILADLQGPKLRVGKIENGSMPIKKGDILTFVNEECMGNMERVYMSYQKFAKEVNKDDRILVDDGKVVLKVVESDGEGAVKLEVIHGSVLSSNKGVNLPDTAISLPSLTEKDMEDLRFILTQPVNWIALSFVRKPEDIMDIKKHINHRNHPAKVIAKIEKPEAINNIKEIINLSDGIMIARGDLGVEMPIEKLPGLQKNIIRRCVHMGKPVIVATQMMESMITNPSPTRAEVTDVANAVLDGTDAVMLSGETATGNHPALVVSSMVKILQEAEKNYEMSEKRIKPDPRSETFHSDVMCIEAARISDVLGAKAITGLTVSGYTAFKLSSFRPKCNIYIFSDRMYMLNTLNLVWGVKCFHYSKFTTTDETIDDIREILKENKIVKKGDIVVNTASMPLLRRLRTNMVKMTLIE
jgi:pyruvate kinase